jgi:allantoin racemase
MPARGFEFVLIHVVNPNTTQSMTDKIGVAAQKAAAGGTEILTTQSDMGPVSIEGYYDEAYAVPGMLARIAEAEAMGVAGHVIACFDDTGLDAARALAAAPVVGIGEAAFHAASLVAYKFSVVTTLGRSIPAIEHNLLRYGLATRCARVRAAEVAVLSLEERGSQARTRISQEIDAAKRDDGCEAIVLGCAGMADLARDLSNEHGLPVIDGVAVAVGLIEMLARCGIATSKRGGYAAPRAKSYVGMFKPFAPG